MAYQKLSVSLLLSMYRLRKHYYHLVEGWFLTRKAASALSECMTTNSADYYMLVNDGHGQSHEFAD